ncbi:MAG: hypothetical protein HEP71_28620 [Roseivirga sp.]|nr:hypothetical protein [Roseivirga sp.]
MLEGLVGRGLFVFSDPGGAKAILAYVKINQLTDYLIVSDRQYDFFEDFGLEVLKASAEDAVAIADGFKPDYLLTGTSYTSRIELGFIKTINQRKITTAAFIDHYTRFQDRFEMSGEMIYPHQIGVIDEKARGIAHENSLTKHSQIVVTGNFYHQFLEEWTPAISKAELYDQLGLDIGKKLVVFAPEPLSNVENARGVFGFDEIETTSGLIDSLSTVSDGINLVLTAHPNQNITLLHPIIEGRLTLNNGRVGVNELIHYADMVIGMFSNFLIEAIAMNRPVLRYFCKPVLHDPLSGSGVGKVVDDAILLSEIKSL